MIMSSPRRPASPAPFPVMPAIGTAAAMVMVVAMLVI
jgi:hypothetical protein